MSELLTSPRPRTAGFLWVIAIGALIRLALLPIIAPSSAGDGQWYLAAAEAFRHGALPDLYRPPLYPLFLSVLPDWRAAFVIQSVMTIGTAWLCYRVIGSLLAAVLIASCPFLVAYDYGILAETLLICLLVSGWLALYSGRAVVAGILLGLAIMTRDTVVLLPIFAIPFGLWLGRGKVFLVAAGVAYLVVAPWVISQGALSSGRAGYALWIGTWERNADWMLPGLNQAAYPSYAFTREGQEAELREAFRSGNDEAFKRAAIARIEANPLETASVWAQRYPRLWLGTRTDQADLRLDAGSRSWTLFKSAMGGLNLLVLIAGVGGLVVTRQPLFAIPILYTALVYVPFHNTETRYSLPAIPFLLIYVAMIGERLIGWQVSRK